MGPLPDRPLQRRQRAILRQQQFFSVRSLPPARALSRLDQAYATSLVEQAQPEPVTDDDARLSLRSFETHLLAPDPFRVGADESRNRAEVDLVGGPHLQSLLVDTETERPAHGPPQLYRKVATGNRNELMFGIALGRTPHFQHAPVRDDNSAIRISTRQR